MSTLHEASAAYSDVAVGLFGIGLDTYWPQFPGLRQRLEGYQARIRHKLAQHGVHVVDAGLIDTPDKAREAAGLFRREGVEMLFLYVSTYALSSTVLPVVQQVKVPVVVLNLQPVAAIDYRAFNSLGDRGLMTGEWLAHCQACAAPEIASVFLRSSIPYHLVTGTLDDTEAWQTLAEWVAAARVAAKMRRNRVGVLGHYYGGMLDVYSDMTQHSAAFGCHFEILEMCELREYRDAVTREEINRKIRQFQAEFDVSPECSQAELERAARTSCALDRLVEVHRLGSMAYYYEGRPGNEYEDIVTSIIPGNSLLTAHGVPVAGEYEIKNVQAMKILDLLGAGGSFSEFYAMDFEDDVVLLGHDGPGHIAIADGRVKLVPLPVYHGKPGKGLSIEMRVKHGPVTLLSVAQDAKGRLRLVAAQGEAVPGPILHIGNTNSRYRFPTGARAFVDAWSQAGPAHHCAIGVGCWCGVLEKLAAVWNMDFVRVC
ncbi:MAG: arabinose isomerase [Chthonomonadales bacterium]